jgi:hypothetical protein
MGSLIFNITYFENNKYFTSVLIKSDKSKVYEFQSKVECFEFKYRHKSSKQLNEVIENEDIMKKEVIQAALNLLESFDTFK